MQEGLAAFHRDLLERFEAVGRKTGAGDVDALHARGAEFAQRGFGIGLEPFGLAEARLEGHAVVRGCEAQARGEQARGLEALRLVGIAELDVARGNAVEAQQQHLAAALVLPVRLDAPRERLDIAGVVVELVDEAELGHAALRAAPVVDGIDHARGGGGRVLRVALQHEHALDAFGLQRIEPRADRGIGIAHRIAHRHAVAAPAQHVAQALRLPFAPDLERRALGQPDARVLGGRLRGPHAQDDAVQDRQPEQARDLDHARIAEEVREIAAHGAGGGGIGRTQVAPEDGGAAMVVAGASEGLGGMRYSRA